MHSQFRPAPLYISHLEAQVTWYFTFKWPGHFLSTFKVTLQNPKRLRLLTWDISGHLNVAICILYLLKFICVNILLCFPIYVQRLSMFIDELCERRLRLRQHRQPDLHIHGSPCCCIPWRHNRVDAGAWRRQQPIARRTVGCVLK